MSCDFKPGDEIIGYEQCYRRKAFVYHLVDPTDQTVKYVGSTVNPTARYLAHLNEALSATRCRTSKDEWIVGLLKLGMQFVMRIVSSCDIQVAGVSELREYESQKASGAVLLNGCKPKKDRGGKDMVSERINASISLLT